MAGKVTKELLEKILPEWDVDEYEDGGFDVSSHSPEGEHVIVSLNGDTLSQMACCVDEIYNDFDPQDHAAQIYHEKHYGTPEEREFYASAPDDLEDLLADAKAIDEMYYSVADALRRADEER